MTKQEIQGVEKIRAWHASNCGPTKLAALTYSSDGLPKSEATELEKILAEMSAVASEHHGIVEVLHGGRVAKSQAEICDGRPAYGASEVTLTCALRHFNEAVALLKTESDLCGRWLALLPTFIAERDRQQSAAAAARLERLEGLRLAIEGVQGGLPATLELAAVISRSLPSAFSDLASDLQGSVGVQQQGRAIYDRQQTIVAILAKVAAGLKPWQGE